MITYSYIIKYVLKILAFNFLLFRWNNTFFLYFVDLQSANDLRFDGLAIELLANSVVCTCVVMVVDDLKVISSKPCCMFPNALCRCCSPLALSLNFLSLICFLIDSVSMYWPRKSCTSIKSTIL